MKQAGRTAVQFNVNAQQISNYDIALSPIHAQMDFVRIVEQFDRLRALQYEAARQVDHLFSSLLHRAFTPSP